MSLLEKLLGGISIAALFSSQLADEVDKRRENERVFGLRPTLRKPERHPGFKIASPWRAKKRRDARNAFLKQVRKEQEVGSDPFYLNGYSRDQREQLSAEWRGHAKAWDKANG